MNTVVNTLLQGFVLAAFPLSICAGAQTTASSEVSYAPVPANLRAKSDPKRIAAVKVLDISQRAVYVLPPFGEDPLGDTYKTNFGQAMRMRHLAHEFPFDTLDMNALRMDAPWILTAQSSFARMQTPAKSLRALLDKLNRPILESSDVELPDGFVESNTTIRDFLWRMAQREGSRRYLDLARARPQLLGPAWAYFCVARDEIARFQKKTPSRLGADLLLHFEFLEKCLGRLLMPRMPMGNDRELLQKTLLLVEGFAAPPAKTS